MSEELTAEALRPHLNDRPELIDAALAALYAGDARNLSMDAVEVNAQMLGIDIADLLVLSLNQHKTAGKFVSFLKGHGVTLMLTDAPADLVDDFADTGDLARGPDNDTVDHQAMAGFAARSHAFRCRISVGGQVMGSGALVSPRLVLTAAHVIQPVLEAAGNGAVPEIEVIASDTHSYAARTEFSLPCHPDEHSGALPPADHAETHVDVALLRVDHPLGQMYGHIDLPQEPTHWIGKALFFLVHFPNGAEKGLAVGNVLRDGDRPIRLPHNINAAGGSSGGAGFDRRFTFLGIHQGRFGNFRRIVPYDRFAKHEGFRKALEADKPPRYLWSLDGSLDSHLIIGRSLLFDGLSAIVEGTAPRLRGLWVRRMSTDNATGLSFSHDLLEGFLRAHRAPHRIFRVPLDLGVDDLVGHIFDITTEGDTPVAADGVADGQTTDVAHDDERMRRLVDKLDTEATTAGCVFWLYVDNPPAGLTAETQVQLEHFVQAVMTRSNLRIVIAGYETIGLVNALTESVEDARRSLRPNLLVEHLGDFSLRDVEMTVKEMARALGLDWTEAVIEHIAAFSVRNVLPKIGQVFDPSNFGIVSDVIREEARRMLER